MEIFPRKVVLAVAGILVLLAGLGAYQGWRRSAVDTDSADAGAFSLTATPVAGARNAAPLAEGGAMTEAQVREIARQEARSVLGRPESTPTPAPEGGGPPSSVATPAATPARPSLAPAGPRATPAPTSSPAPAASGGDPGGPAPLF